MKTVFKKLAAVMMVIVMTCSAAITAFAGIEQSVEEAYNQCAQIYPDFVSTIKSKGVTDAQIITFLKSVQEYMLNLGEEVTERNFEMYLIDAVPAAASLRKNIAVRNALAEAYPEAVVDAMDGGTISPEFEPIIETVKIILFGTKEEPTENTEETEETNETNKPTESTEKTSENETEPTQAKPDATESTTESPTENATEGTSEKETEANKPTSANGTGGYTDEDVTESTTEDETETTEVPTQAPTRPADKTFSDMNEASWAEEAVYALVDMGVIAGYPDKTFLPNKSITRAEFAKIIVLASGSYDKNAQCAFTDVDKEKDWFYPYVASAYELGYINGRSATVFDPNANITRAELCTVVYRFIKKANSEFKATTEANFADGAQIPEFAKEAVSALYGAGIVGGMGNGAFEPMSAATRAQSAKIIYGAIKAALGI